MSSSISSRFRRFNDQTVGLDDSANVPTAGFLNTDFVRLPTYQPKNSNQTKPFSHTGYEELTVNEVLSTMRQESRLARCVLFETARLQRSPFAVGALKLPEETCSAPYA